MASLRGKWAVLKGDGTGPMGPDEIELLAAIFRSIPGGDVELAGADDAAVVKAMMSLIRAGLLHVSFRLKHRRIDVRYQIDLGGGHKGSGRSVVKVGLDG